MGWQDVGVLVIVTSAVAFLVRRLVPGRAEGAQTFVPLGQIKTRREHDQNCH
jgi:hypothetical protein